MFGFGSQTPTHPTRITISFGMAVGGAMFVQWLRNRLMRDYGLFSADSVYVDHVSSRNGKCTYDVEPRWYQFGYAKVSPDPREKVMSMTGTRPIGASNPRWEPQFRRAMNQSEVVLFVNTPEFQRSEWCQQELGNFGVMLGKRENVRGVVLDLDGTGLDLAAHGLPADRMTVIPMARAGMRQGMLWDIGLWGIDEGAYGALVAAIGQHPEWREAA